jgi:trans-aconitate 2-methyltransferase
MTEKQNKYAWNAEDYAKHSSPQYQWAKELIPKLKLSGNERLLDIGCGDGKITAVLAKSLPQGRIIGVDNSEDMINLARANFPSSTYPNLSFQVMDARVLSFECYFDRVFSNAALHWVIDHRPILRGVQRSLRNGGRLLFQMGGKATPKAYFRFWMSCCLNNRGGNSLMISLFRMGFTRRKSIESGCVRRI